MLQHARVTIFTVSELLRENQQEGLKDALRNVTMILWQSLSPVSMVQVLQKDLGLLISIISSKVSFKVLQQVLESTMLVKEKLSMK